VVIASGSDAVYRVRVDQRLLIDGCCLICGLIELCDLLGKGKNMSIILGQNKWVLVGVLAVIIAGGIGAYLFLYPQEEKVSHAVVAPKSPPHVAAPAIQPPPVAAPKAAVAPAQAIAPVATPPVAASTQALQPPLKLSKTIKAAKNASLSGKPPRPKNSDLRDCLKLETDAAIAKCAGE
jgi:hypothetical protein